MPKKRLGTSAPSRPRLTSGRLAQKGPNTPQPSRSDAAPTWRLWRRQSPQSSTSAKRPASWPWPFRTTPSPPCQQRCTPCHPRPGVWPVARRASGCHATFVHVPVLT